MAGESIGAGRLLFQCSVPATGESAYRLQSLSTGKAEGPSDSVTVQTSAEGLVTVESDLYKITIDPKRGGILSGLYAKQLNRDFCATGERCFHEFRGYFIEEKAWRSSTEGLAVIQLLETGPVRVTVSISGKVSSVPFRTIIRVTQGQRRIEFHTQFRFERDTWIGDPWEIPAAERMTGRRRSEYDDRFKLLALFPVSFQQQAIYKNSAFDVCRSANVDTFFNSWDTIKHNIIHNWVDLVDEREGLGLALLTDHTTSYAHGKDHPLSLVMGWGWDGGYWWGKCPLNGLQEMQYAIIPHAGRWDKAGLWRETAELSEPLLCRLAGSKPERPSRFMVRIDDPGVQLSAVTAKDRDLLFRVFNAESERDEHEITIGMHSGPVGMVEVDGRTAAAVSAHNATGRTIRVKVPRFGLKTIRVPDVVS